MDETVYRSAREAGFVFLSPARSLIRMTGADRLDFLNRMSTNETVKLAPGQATETVLTDEKARILDDLVVLNLEKEVLMLSARAEPDFVMNWLNRYVIMDDVKLEAVPELNLMLLGSGDDDEKQNGGLGDFGTETYLFPTRYGKVLAFAGDPSAVVDRITATSALVRIDAALFEILRVEKGIPDWPAELGDRFNPLEAGLERAVSFSKGCYIGQEVIARLDSRDKVKRHLAGFRFEHPVEPGADVYWEDRKIGEVTSAVVSPGYGPIGLGYVRVGTKQGTEVNASSAASKTSGIVAKLPFRAGL